MIGIVKRKWKYLSLAFDGGTIALLSHLDILYGVFILN